MWIKIKDFDNTQVDFRQIRDASIIILIKNQLKFKWLICVVLEIVKKKCCHAKTVLNIILV